MPVGAPPVDAACSVTNKVAFSIGPVVPVPPDVIGVDDSIDDYLITTTYNAVGFCCLSEYQPPEFGKSSVTEAGCISFDCDEVDPDTCGATHAAAEPGSPNEATFSFTVNHVIGPGNSAQYFEQLLACCEKHAWRECQFDSNGDKVQRIFPCGWVSGYSPDAINEDSGKPTATVTVTLCEGNPIHV